MITFTREEAQQVLDVLKDINKLSVGVNAIFLPAEIDEVMETIRAKLSAPEPEPVAFQCCEHGDDEWFITSAEAYKVNPNRYKYRALYTAPPQREWVGLTDKEITDLWEAPGDSGSEFARAVEAKLKEKNT